MNELDPPPAQAATVASRPARLAAALLVGALVTLVIRPLPNGAMLWPDAVEHLAIANSWAHGSGFVDPVQYFDIETAGPVVPAHVVRAPLVPFLLGLAFWAGATLLTIFQLYAAWSCVVIAALVYVASGFLRLPFAILVGLGVALMPSWIRLSRQPMTEPTAILAFLSVLGTLRVAAKSRTGAGVAALLAIVAAAARLNFAALPLAAIVALLLDGTLRRRFVSGPLWVYLLTLAATAGALYGLAVAATGWPPYSGYGTLATALVESGTEQEVVGSFLLRNAEHLAQMLFADPQFGYIGWIGLPGVLWCLTRPRSGAPEGRFCALTALGFSALATITLGGWDASRYPLPVAIAAALCAGVWLDHAAAGAERRWSLRWAPIALAAGLATVLFTVAVVGSPRIVKVKLRAWPLENHQNTPFAADWQSRGLEKLCRKIPAGAFVASHDPWRVTMWCGNPSMKLPDSLHGQRRRRLYFGRRGMPFVLATQQLPSWLHAGPIRLRPMGRSQRWQLFRAVGTATRPPQWSAPPPLVCAGRPALCARRFGRNPSPMASASTHTTLRRAEPVG